MGNKRIIVRIGLDEILEDTFSGSCKSLEKDIGSDKNVLVREMFDYLMNTESDELNPRKYDNNERELAEFINRVYSNREDSNILYEKNSGGVGYMQFNQKLSKYLDAFHKKGTAVEYGKIEDLEESESEQMVHLKAVPQDLGGEK